jgi:hypothetical protein
MTAHSAIANEQATNAAPSRHCERSEAIHLSLRESMDYLVANAPRNDVKSRAGATSGHNVIDLRSNIRQQRP